MERLTLGEVLLNVSISTRFHDTEELTVVASVSGNSMADEELVISAHVQEPGANDNASGVGAALEMAETVATLVRNGEYSPMRTLTFLWGDEIRSTQRYVNETNRKIRWGFSLDMVGENTSITGGSFLIEKMPDPGAIWTRGREKHTEWGGKKLSMEDLVPHYLNDFIIKRFEKQGSRTGWEVKTNPYEGGSDHVPFLRDSIPAVLFWHFTDQFYHTDQDRLDKVSKNTLENVVTAGLVASLMLVNADIALAKAVLQELEKEAAERLMEEASLSKTIIANGGDVAEEELILNTWIDYYLQVISTITDMTDADLSKEIKESQEEVRQVGQEALRSLQ